MCGVNILAPTYKNALTATDFMSGWGFGPGPLAFPPPSKLSFPPSSPLKLATGFHWQ